MHKRLFWLTAGAKIRCGMWNGTAHFFTDNLAYTGFCHVYMTHPMVTGHLVIATACSFLWKQDITLGKQDPYVLQKNYHARDLFVAGASCNRTKSVSQKTVFSISKDINLWDKDNILWK